MKIALVHDHLAQDGGAENVLRAFCQIWPDAPIYVVVHDPKNAHPFFLTKDVRTSFIQRMPWGLKKYQWYFPLMPTAVESYDLSEFDVVLSTTSSFAKGVITRPETLHISYCHTPTRFLWSDTHSYVREVTNNPIFKKLIPVFLTRVRMWDRLAAERVDQYITNSKAVQKRLQKYYHRDSTVIYPPVDVTEFTPVAKEEVGDYYLAGGRLVAYKRFDLIVEAFLKIGKPLKIFGSGPEMSNLKRLAASNPKIELLGRVPDEQRRELFSKALAFINPQEEDFGITMIESLAAGRPVIGLNKAGAKEIVTPGVHGELMEFQSWEDLANTVMNFDPMQYDPQIIRERALTFQLSRFTTEIENAVQNAYNQFQKELDS
jgi:glycosyltransferase involved in cell wall biosynthesis